MSGVGDKVVLNDGEEILRGVVFEVAGVTRVNTWTLSGGFFTLKICGTNYYRMHFSNEIFRKATDDEIDKDGISSIFRGEGETKEIVRAMARLSTPKHRKLWSN